MSEILRAQLALALKHRPLHLDDLAGQDSTVSRLKGIIKTRNIPNAVMFIGHSGCGKTTASRILARTINCEKLTGCGKCRSCIAFDNKQHPDYEELNAADSRGIDDMRAMLQKAKMMPQLGNMRVIVLDECQMLTPQAQQSILKNLEEPAERTLWILSSMNPEKLNPAIVNRCQQFHLKLMDREAISSRLRYICGEEGIKERVITDSLLNSMADLSGGHMRQAVQLLEATIQYMNGADGIKESEMSEWLRKNVVESALIDSDDNVAARILLCLYLGNTKMLQKSICDATDYFGLAIKLIQLNTYLLDQLMFGAQHRNVWHTFQNKAVWELLQSKVPDLSDRPHFKVISIHIQNVLIALRKELGNFVVPERSVYSGLLQECCFKVKSIKLGDR